MRSLAVSLLVVLVLGGVVLAGCAGSESDDTTTIEVRAENLRFEPEVVTIPAGKTVKLLLRNLDLSEHDLEVVGLRPVMMSGGGHQGHGQLRLGPPVVAVHTDGKTSASVTLRVDEPGTYEFFCTVPGHREVGMVGRLIVS